jgi:hypothetical protein
MKKLSAASLIVLSLVAFVISWPFAENFLSRSAQLKIINSSDSNYICSYYGDSSFDDDFYYMNKSLGLKYDNRKIVADVLMYKAEKSYTIAPFSSYTSIENDEMIVSRNVANQYNIEIGDTVVVSSSLYDDSFEYCVKEIIEPVFCFTEEYFVEDKGIVVLGNNSSLVETNNISVAFVSDEENLNGISLEKITSISEYKSNLLQDIIIDCGIVVCLACLMIVAYFVLFEVISSFRIRKAIISGASPKAIIRRYYLNPVVWSVIYSALTVIFTLAEGWVLFNMFIIPLPLAMILFIPVVACVISALLLKMKLRRN